MNSGIQKWSGEEMTPGVYDDLGRSNDTFLLTKSVIRWAGAVCLQFPFT